jgi:tRNA (mo5U34)-methyltransferase
MIQELTQKLPAFKQRLDEVKRGIAGIPFYPYDTLGSLHQLERLLRGDNRDLHRLAGGLPIADIGAADGDLAFFLETQGFDVHIIDNGPTNMNGLRAARAVAEALRSKVVVHEVDLDSQFSLPQEKYGLVLFLGILYHLKNPYYALEKLARHAQHVALSTRVAQIARPLDAPPPARDLRALAGQVVRRLLPEAPAGMTRIAGLPLAYLVDERECNNDSTNYWMFTREGLERLLRRCGWDVLELGTIGKTRDSDPASAEGDERAFCLARSRVFGRS